MKLGRDAVSAICELNASVALDPSPARCCAQVQHEAAPKSSTALFRVPLATPTGSKLELVLRCGADDFVAHHQHPIANLAIGFAVGGTDLIPHCRIGVMTKNHIGQVITG